MHVTTGTRERILSAAVACVGRAGFTRSSIDEIAAEAGVGRATVYRHFPDGKDQLFTETIAHEVEVFFVRLADHVADAPGLAARLEAGIPFAHRMLADHEVFQKVLETEPERLLPHLSTSFPLILAALRTYLVPLLEGERLREGVDTTDAADHLARVVLTFIRGPGHWDLDDPDQVRLLVRGYLLAGILVEPFGE